jgi:multiple sugar transport system substrate-binding protein
VGYALTPLGHPELGVGFDLSVSATSKNKEAAYLFIQWLNSKKNHSPMRRLSPARTR